MWLLIRGKAVGKLLWHCLIIVLMASSSKVSLAAFVGCMMPMMLGVCFLCPSMDCLWHKYHYCPECKEKVTPTPTHKYLFLLLLSFTIVLKRKILPLWQRFYCRVTRIGMEWNVNGDAVMRRLVLRCRLPISRNQIFVLWWIRHSGRRKALHCLEYKLLSLLECASSAFLKPYIYIHNVPLWFLLECYNDCS